MHIKKRLIDKNLLCFLMSIASTLKIPAMLKSNDLFSFSNSIVSIMIFVLCFCLYKKAFAHREKRLFIISLAVGLLFSTFMVVGRNSLVLNRACINSLDTWLTILCETPLFCSGVMLTIKNFDRLNSEFIPLVENFNLKLRKRTVFIIVWMLIFICWMPTLAASYPGIYGYDSIYQLNYYISGNISLHHPLIHTYLLGFLVHTVGKILGSYEAGMFCYSVFQSAALSGVFSYIYTYYLRKRMSVSLRIVCLIFYALFWTNPIMAFSATKDTLFAAFMALAFTQLLLLCEDVSKIKSKRFCISLILVFLMLSSFRNQGIYIIFLTGIIAYIIFKKFRKQTVLLFGTSLILIYSYSNFVCPALGGIKPEKGVKEMLSVPCMQLSRAMIESGDRLSEEEKKLIKEYMPRYDVYEKYPAISDTIKNTFDTKKFKDNPFEFFRLWASVGEKCPASYIDAFTRLTVGIYYPDMNYRDSAAYHPYFEYYVTGREVYADPDKYLLLKQSPKSGFEWLDSFYYDMAYSNSYQNIPLLSLLFSSAIPVWFVILYIAIVIYRKEYVKLVPASLLAGLTGTLLLGPVVLYRYMYPITICVPMLTASLLKNKKQGELKNEKNCRTDSML